MVQWVVLTKSPRESSGDVVKLPIYKRKENTACVPAHVSWMSAVLQDRVALCCFSGWALPEGRQALRARQTVWPFGTFIPSSQRKFDRAPKQNSYFLTLQFSPWSEVLSESVRPQGQSGKEMSGFLLKSGSLTSSDLANSLHTNSWKYLQDSAIPSSLQGSLRFPASVEAILTFLPAH